MSLLAMKAVWSARLTPPGLKLTALAMADWCADDGRRLYPSMAAVADRVGVTKAQARRHVHALIEMGLLSVEANLRGGAPGVTPRYRLHFDRLTANSNARGDTGARGNADAKDGLHACTGRLAPMHETAGTDASQSINSHQTAIKEPSKARATGARYDARASLLSLGVPEDLADEWIAFRRSRRSSVSSSVLDVFKREAGKIGWTLEAVLRECIAQGWNGFQADRVAVKPGRTNPTDIARMTVPGTAGEDPVLKKIKEDDAQAVAPPPEFRAYMESLRHTTSNHIKEKL